jgi:hypothetical protein
VGSSVVLEPLVQISLMNKRAVWIASLILIVLTLASVAYRVASPMRFDAAVWQRADEPAEFDQRRAMMSDVNQMFAKGTINDKVSAVHYLGRPQRGDVDADDSWRYDLGGSHTQSTPNSTDWLELTFDSSGRLLQHRITQQWDEER